MSSADEPGMYSQQNKYLISEGHQHQYSQLPHQWKHSHILKKLPVNSDNALTNLYLNHSWQSNESTAIEMTELPLSRKRIVKDNRRQWRFIKQQADFSSDFTSFLQAFIDSLASVVSDLISHIVRLTDKMASFKFIMSFSNLLTFQNFVISIIHLPMSLTGMQDSSLFKGKNVTNFLKHFKDFCKEHGLEKAQ